MIIKEKFYKRGIVMPIVIPIPIEKLPEETGGGKRFTSKFKRKFLFKRKWILDHDYVFYIPGLDKWVIIPKGFITDFGSVPKLLNSIYGATDLLLYGSLPHDFGYRYEGILYIDPKTSNTYFESMSKKELDKLFNELNEYETNMKIGTDSAYIGLKLFGFTGGNENRKKNCILTEDFPDYYEV